MIQVPRVYKSSAQWGNSAYGSYTIFHAFWNDSSASGIQIISTMREFNFRRFGNPHGFRESLV
jgi:hypothetical protein